MSLRAIKKRDTHPNSESAGPRQTLFKKANTSPTQRKSQYAATSSYSLKINNTDNFKESNSFQKFRNLQQQQPLLGRFIYSCPELCHPQDDTLERFQHLVRTKSDGDVRALEKSCTGNAADTAGRGLIGAKSEVCLQSIASHNYQETSRIPTPSTSIKHNFQVNDKMLSGARSHRDISNSAYVTGGGYEVTLSPERRRMSECSLHSSADYSQRNSVISSSALTLSSSNAASNEPNSVMRVPIIGYEVMEERARFTVYKLRVENPLTNDCWLVLRRYTDFVRLNTKLKQGFPNLSLMLPRKKIFGDNFNAVFLDNRVQGLQIFVNSIMAKEELRKCKLVREFFCLDEPPSYSESMEECRAIFEAQEETIAHLKMQVNSKNELILSLQQKLRDEVAEKEELKAMLKNSSRCSNCAESGAINH